MPCHMLGDQAVPLRQRPQQLIQSVCAKTCKLTHTSRSCWLRWSTSEICGRSTRVDSASGRNLRYASCSKKQQHSLRNLINLVCIEAHGLLCVSQRVPHKPFLSRDTDSTDMHEDAWHAQPRRDLSEEADSIACAEKQIQQLQAAAQHKWSGR